MKKPLIILGYIISVLLISYGVYSAIITANKIWYSFFSIGLTIFLGLINLKIKNKSAITEICSKPRRFIKIYTIYLVIGIIYEILGNYFLHLWYYPSFNFAEMIIHVFLIGYPFALFSAYETYRILHSKNLFLGIISTTLLSAFIHEIPNIYAQEWIYTIPYIKWSILGINIIVVIGWVLLVIPNILIERRIKK